MHNLHCYLVVLNYSQWTLASDWNSVGQIGVSPTFKRVATFWNHSILELCSTKVICPHTITQMSLSSYLCLSAPFRKVGIRHTLKFVQDLNKKINKTHQSYYRSLLLLFSYYEFFWNLSFKLSICFLLLGSKCNIFNIF